MKKIPLIIFLSLIFISSASQDEYPIRNVYLNKDVVFKLNVNDTIKGFAYFICTFTINKSVLSVSKIKVEDVILKKTLNYHYQTKERSLFDNDIKKDSADHWGLVESKEKLEEINLINRIRFLIDSTLINNKDKIKFSYDTLSIQCYENSKYKMQKRSIILFKVAPLKNIGSVK
ncbi:hypothetical protein [Bacteroides sedimenti]|uniref:DUF3868 domain-containing protein n=1 Tax=Bacteroides sedimenti TaxID=2136147 RepID=A0ABM8I7T1_9BACE